MTNLTSNDHGDEFIAKHGSSFVKADSLVQQGKHGEAIQVFFDLLSMPSNPYVKAVMWINIAVIRDKMGQPDDALHAYDEAVLLERSYNGYVALERKALYLAQKGRISESLLILDALMRRTDVRTDDRKRIEANVTTLRSG
jgi:tetratricopeptide (TPR) repeat protein